MKRLVALRETYYNGTRQAGEAFDATDQDATILLALGTVRELDIIPLVPPPLGPRAPTPAEPPKPENAPPQPAGQAAASGVPVSAPKPKRKYTRRDMRAED